MKILYGVVGEGMGHATRSKVVLGHLLSRKHDVRVVVSGRAHGFLKKSLPAADVIEIKGLTMVYEGNRVSKSQTLLELIREAPDALHHNTKVMDSLKHYRPDAVISDFDSFSYLFGRLVRVPIVSIDNMSMIDRCDHSEVHIPVKERVSYELARGIVAGKLPKCYQYLVTTFFYPPIAKPDTRLVPPILRDTILKAVPTQQDHVLVYQTATAYEQQLLKALRDAGGKYIVYGLRRNEDLGNIQLKDFSEDGFVADLASARAVVSGGGYSLMGEAVYLRKPYFALPLGGQFEQMLNALYLEKLGYGQYADTLEPDQLRSFLERVDEYAKNLAGYQQNGNQVLFDAVDSLLEEITDTANLTGWRQ